MKKIKFIYVIILLLFLSCRENIVEFSEEEKVGKLLINSSPQGAEIYFENNRTGKVTPDSLTHIQPGTYLLKLHLSGFADEIMNVNLKSGQKRSINITFRGY